MAIKANIVDESTFRWLVWAKKFNPLTNKRGKVTWRRALATTAALAAIVLLTVFGFKYNDAQNRADQLSSDPQAAARAAIVQITKEVGKIVVLPANETPTLATVNDASKLKGQAFFANAQNDDKVLIYTQAKLAVLYRPSVKKIINIAPLNIGSGTNTPSSKTSQ